MKIINLKYRKYCFVVTVIIMIIQTVCKQIYLQLGMVTQLD